MVQASTPTTSPAMGGLVHTKSFGLQSAFARYVMTRQLQAVAVIQSPEDINKHDADVVFNDGIGLFYFILGASVERVVM